MTPYATVEEYTLLRTGTCGFLKYTYLPISAITMNITSEALLKPKKSTYISASFWAVQPVRGFRVEVPVPLYLALLDAHISGFLASSLTHALPRIVE